MVADLVEHMVSTFGVPQAIVNELGVHQKSKPSCQVVCYYDCYYY